LFGFLGVLLALPVASVLVVVLRYFYRRYRDSALYHAEASQMNPNAEPVQQIIMPEPIVIPRAEEDAPPSKPPGDT